MGIATILAERSGVVKPAVALGGRPASVERGVVEREVSALFV